MTAVESKSAPFTNAELELVRRDGVPHKLVRRTGRAPRPGVGGIHANESLASWPEHQPPSSSGHFSAWLAERSSVGARNSRRDGLKRPPAVARP